jgi:hypothetical protein
MIDRMKPVQSLTLAFSVALCASAPALASKKVPSEPAGVKVASSAQIAIYVVSKQSKPFAQTGQQLNIFEASMVVNNTLKHGRQIIRSRFEAIDADLQDPAMWQIGDFDGDGFDDVRAVAQISKQGCRVWATETWLPDRERFTFAQKINYKTDANGTVVKVCR